MIPEILNGVNGIVDLNIIDLNGLVPHSFEALTDNVPEEKLFEIANATDVVP